MKPFVVLMYHGLYDSAEEWQQIPAEEKPYAVSATQFREHLQAIQDAGAHVLTQQELEHAAGVADQPYPVLITFDDGDKGWIRHALPALQAFGYQGTFFVTSDLIDNLPHFCNWDDIRALADAGMNVQSHGRTHRFLADLSADDCRQEFTDSKRVLEQATGKTVTAISFPGGRFQMRDVAIGQEAGFRFFHTSKLGLNDPANGMQLLKRFAVRHNTGPKQIHNWVTAHQPTILRQVLLATLKDGIKTLLGNAGYHRLYRLIKG